MKYREHDYMIKVYYDGICGYCSKEINYYKTIAPPMQFTWLDVANDPNAMINYNISQSEALLFLHAFDETDKIYVGSEAFALIWKNLPRWKVLGHIISLPVVSWVTKYAYVWFAKRRFNNYSHCKLAETKLPRRQLKKTS